jgi:hypothetical protein
MGKFSTLMESLGSTVDELEEFRLVVENFDPDKAKGSYELTKIDGVSVMIPSKIKGEQNEDNTIIINQSDIIDTPSSFCKHNPEINKFAMSSPDNMFFVLGLVAGTVGSSWVDFRNLYPVYAAYIKETNGKPLRIDNLVGIDGKKRSIKQWMFRGASKNLIALWEQREELYKQIFETGLYKDSYELYKYIVYAVRGMSTVKAGFAVQLLTGKLGCIDNINTDVYGVPIILSKPDGSSFKSASFSKKDGEKTDNLTASGKKIIGGYIDFLKAIEKSTKSEVSQRLWDDWVQLAAAKAVFSASHKYIQYNLVDGRVIVMPTYKRQNAVVEYGEYLKNLQKDGIDPYGGYDISKEHLDLPVKSGEIDDVNSRIS